MSSMIQWCDVPRPSVKRPSHTAWFDSVAWAIAIGCRVWIGTTAVPSSIRAVARPRSVIAVNASKSPGTWGTQIDRKPASSAAFASATSRATFSRYRPGSGPIITPIRMAMSGNSILVLREYKFHGENRGRARRARRRVAAPRGLEEPERRAHPRRAARAAVARRGVRADRRARHDAVHDPGGRRPLEAVAARVLPVL